ncbi:hypothetical protein [Peribacillus simplex]|uniref:hypothetical protein n=1 Tax=Peribacillus simplex TaxID=1478 RepID=UPI002852FF4C|nr:hypothetical protein [Peribacillus simplex]MDR4928918.1 hypothetical protein [Peribacillus simplex]
MNNIFSILSDIWTGIEYLLSKIGEAMGHLALILSDSTFIGALVGGVFAIGGSYLAANSQIKAQRDIFVDENSRNIEQYRWNLKFELLSDFQSHRGCLSNNPKAVKESTDPRVFFAAINRIEIAFFDSPDVIEKYHRYLASKENQNLFELSVAMHKNLGMASPDKDRFLNPLMME